MHDVDLLPNNPKLLYTYPEKVIMISCLKVVSKMFCNILGLQILVQQSHSLSN